MDCSRKHFFFDKTRTAKLRARIGTDARPDSVWKTRGYLPHRHEAGEMHLVGYRLSDSLPKNVLLALREKTEALPEEIRNTQLMNKIEKMLDSGFGSSCLTKPCIAERILSAWNFFDGKRYELISGVVMPNHVHVLLRLFEGETLGKIVHSWKQFVSTNTEMDVAWNHGYWDRMIRSEAHLRFVMDYIRENPCKAALEKTPEAWQWFAKISPRHGNGANLAAAALP